MDFVTRQFTNMFMPFSADDVEEARKEAINTKIKNIEIDTVFTVDTGKWETGICINDNWVIVELYSSKDKATKGHEKWVISIKKNPKQKLVDVLVDDWVNKYEKF